THRLTIPEETLARVRPHLAAMGVTRVANITGLDRIGIPVVMVCRPNSRTLAVHQGKGRTLAAARASALMEAVETHHAERIALPLKVAAYRTLRRAQRVVDAHQLPRLRASRFHPDRRIPWIEGWDLMAGEPVWVPYEIVHANYSLPRPPGSGCFWGTTNGLASGNHPLEAISHGICEVVERDAATLWCHLPRESQDRTRVDLQSVEDGACREMLDRFTRAGVAVGVWEATADTGFPSFICEVAERDLNPLRPIGAAWGIGCHPARGVALVRALTEAAQSRLTLIAGSREDIPRGQYERILSPEVQVCERAYIEPQGPMRDFRDAPTWEAETFDEDLAWELERLKAVGVKRVVVVDLTRTEFHIPVMRVVIPGLEGPGFGEGSSAYVPGARARRALQFVRDGGGGVTTRRRRP
ncbi:MAG TPA: YcaO-like family protein, partial [Candidatus Methylomirabilis sp.]|nr:YcaO-like family protein [Candidatus Methylomirabilis sp.]